VQAIAGGASFLNGAFAEGHAALNGNLPIAEAVFVTHIDASLQLNPNFAFGGGLGVSAGPEIAGVRAIGVDGHFDFTSAATAGAPDDYSVSGDIKIADKLTLANGNVDYKTNGQLGLAGHLKLAVLNVGFEGDIGGFASAHAFEVSGKGTVGFKGHGVGGDGIVSSTGVGACAHFLFADVGFGARWNKLTHPHIFAGSCDLDTWKVSRSVSASAPLPPGGARSFRLRGGMRVAAFSAVGIGAPPSITVTGPGGVTVSSPSADPGLAATDTYVAFTNAADNTSYIAVGRPAKGTWTVHVNPGSVPVNVVRSANGVARPRVRAHVSGHGYRRVLTFHARHVAGQRIVFFERTPGGGARIGASRKSHGRLRFTPAAGPAGRRGIVAEVQQNGLVRLRQVVTTYKAPASRRPGHVRRASVVRGKHHRAIVSWSRARRAAHYEIHVRTSDGRRLFFLRRPRNRHVRIPRIYAHTRVRARITPVSAAGRDGRSHIARGPKHRRRH
jgi:hypothetical protein